MRLKNDEKELLLELIGNEQIHMISKNYKKQYTDKYMKLEKLKVKIKDM